MNIKNATWYTKITKDQFYAYGGFSNPRCVRVTRGKSWSYFFRYNAQ